MEQSDGSFDSEVLTENCSRSTESDTSGCELEV